MTWKASGSMSWWAENGFGCRTVTNPTADPSADFIGPPSVTGCLLNYEYVEVLHAAIQIILSVSLF